jgi:hypothetical protein
MNLSVHTPADTLASVPRPSLERVTNLSLGLGDCLIMCAGFEDRVFGALNAVSEGSERFDVILVNYLPDVRENRGDEIRAHCAKKNIPLASITYDREHPSTFGSELVSVVGNRSGSIYIDISAMSRLLIVQVLVAFRKSKLGFRACSIVYSEAAEYSPTEFEAAEELKRCNEDPTTFVVFLSSGLFEITIVPELSSIGPSSSITRLISFPSLDAHHLLALRAEAQASKYSFIEGTPPNTEKNSWRKGLISRLNHLEDFVGAERYETSTLEYSQTLDCLLNIYRTHGVREQLLIAPTGSKMQSVAVGILRSFIEDIQIVYPTPREFRKPESYSVGIGQIHLLSLASFDVSG